MADFTALKTAIQNAIKQNGNEEITGNLLQDVLLAIVTTLGDGSINNLISALNTESNARQLGDSTLQSNINTVTSAITAINYAIANGCVYAGIATPTGAPATGRVFYLALTAGTYTNYGNKVVTQGINILRYNGSAWSLDVIASIDDAPAPSSNNLIKSGGAFDFVMKNGSAFDLSAYNNGTTYADLNAALTALNALPAAYKKGGMSMKFVQTYDNKYVQCRLMSDEFSTTVTDWQGEDAEPTAGSNNLVKSGGVAASVESLKNAFGVVKETTLTNTTLAYNIDIAPRAESYNLNILIESNREVNVPVYRTINGTQEPDGTPITTGTTTILQIPANTTRLRFVSTGLNSGDTFKFILTEDSELRDEVYEEIQRAKSSELSLQQSINTNRSDISRIDTELGSSYEYTITTSTLQYNIDIEPRSNPYNLELLVTSGRNNVNVQLYRTINSTQESDPIIVNTGERTSIQIPANTTRLRFVQVNLQYEDTFQFVLYEDSELRNELNSVRANLLSVESNVSELQPQVANTSKSVDSLEKKIGEEKDITLTSTTLAADFPLVPRDTAYNLSLLVKSVKTGYVLVYRTINGTQESTGIHVDTNILTSLEIPIGTSNIKVVRYSQSVGDRYIITLYEESELREELNSLNDKVIDNSSVFVSTFDVEKSNIDPTPQIKDMVKWVRLYDYSKEAYSNKQLGISQCYISLRVLTFDIWDYAAGERFAHLTKEFASDAELANAGVIVLGARSTKIQVCLDLSVWDWYNCGFNTSSSTNDYTHRGIDVDKCIKEKLESLRSVFVPTASFIKGGFDITRMISNTIKYLKVRDNSIKIPKIGLSELIWYSNTTILSIKIWDFTNNVELCRFANYYTAQEIDKVRTNLISTNGKWEISIDLTEMNFAVYSVIDSNLDSPFSYEARGFDTSMILTNNLIGEQWSLTKIDNYTNYQGGIIRKTNSKIENSSGTSWGFVYFPVENGKTYRIVGTSVNVYAAAWAVLAFDTKVPESGDSITVIQSYDSDGFKKFDIRYTAPANGYLLASYFHSDGVQGVPLIYKFIEYDNIDAVIPAINEYPLVYEGLSKAEKSFKVGGVSFRALTNGVTSFVPDAFAEQYEPQYAKYLCEAPSKRYGKLIVDDTINMFDASLDAENYKNSYCRQIIGVDSEGWTYISQRLCIYDFETDEKTKILRTKDFITFDTFMDDVVGVQLIELENGELCFAANSTDTYNGVTGYYCNIYVTSNHKTVINKRFHTTRTENGAVGQPWSWGIQSRGSVIAIGEYGAHGKVGGAWYSRDFGEHFYHVFEHSMYAPDYPNAHIHGICVDPYFDRMYIITGDSGRNSRLYWWDYSGEYLSDNLYNTIQWNYIETYMDIYSGTTFQFVCGYALKDCVILGSDGARGGIMRINRGKKEDTPIIDFGVDFGLAQDGQFSTVWCGGNMFRLDDDSPLLICIHREASNDLEPNDPNNPSHYANTYRTVLSKVFATYNGYDFSLLWEDNTYGQYNVWETDDNWATQSVVQKNLAKCGRDMSVYQLPDKTILLKYIGRSFSYVSYDDNGVTNNTKSAYHRFNNYVVKGHLK